MPRSHKIHRRLLLSILIVFDVILICYFNIRRNDNKLNEEKSNTSFYTQTLEQRDPYEQLLVNTYLLRIREASDEFYQEYYTTSPVVIYYSVFLKAVKSEKRLSYVTFTSQPYLGAHNTVGIDEITFLADYHGNVTLDRFHHLKSYDLPEHLKDLEKKRAPHDVNSSLN